MAKTTSTTIAIQGLAQKLLPRTPGGGAGLARPLWYFLTGSDKNNNHNPRLSSETPPPGHLGADLARPLWSFLIESDENNKNNNHNSRLGPETPAQDTWLASLVRPQSDKNNNRNPRLSPETPPQITWEGRHGKATLVMSARK